MPKRKFIKICAESWCDYLPCIEERIAQLEGQGLDSSELRKLAADVRASDGRTYEAEMAWLEAIDKGVANV